MTEPPRFSDGERSALGTSLFRSLRDDEPPADLEDRTLAALGLPLLPPVLPPDAGASAAATKAAATTKVVATAKGATVSAVFAKYFVGSVVVAGLGLGGAKAVNERLSVPPAPAATTSPATPAADGQASVPTTTNATPLVAPPPAAIDGPAAIAVPRVASAAGSSTTVLREREAAPIVSPPSPPIAALPETPAPIVAPAGTALALPLVVPNAPALPSSQATATAAAERTALPIQQELAALDLARSALARGDGAGALRSVDAYRTTFPRGQLGREATVLEIEARLRTGDRSTAERLGRTFLQSAPDSPLAPRVRSLLGLADDPTKTIP